MIRWWVSDSSSSAPRRWSKRSLSITDESGAAGPDRRAASTGEAAVEVDRDLLGAGAAAVLVDRRVAGDLVDPGLEVDLRVGLAQAPQRRHERLLGHVLRAAAVAHEAAHEGGYPRVIAAVQLLEGDVVACPHRGHQLRVGSHNGVSCRDPCGAHLLKTLPNGRGFPYWPEMYPFPGDLQTPPGGTPSVGWGRWPPATRSSRYLDELLEPAAFDDYGPNGLQVPGAAEVQTVVTGVSAQLELFERAAAAGARSSCSATTGCSGTSTRAP